MTRHCHDYDDDDGDVTVNVKCAQHTVLNDPTQKLSSICMLESQQKHETFDAYCIVCWMSGKHSSVHCTTHLTKYKYKNPSSQATTQPNTDKKPNTSSFQMCFDAWTFFCCCIFTFFPSFLFYFIIFFFAFVKQQWFGILIMYRKNNRCFSFLLYSWRFACLI